MANQSQPGGDQFYTALEAKVKENVGRILKVPLITIQYPQQGDFNWWHKNSNGIFNELTYNYITALLSNGDFLNSAKMSAAGGFPNAYIEVIKSIFYSLSPENAKKMEEAKKNAQLQMHTLISNYETKYGNISDQDMKDVGWDTKEDYIIMYIIASKWSGKGDTPLGLDEIWDARDLKKLLPKRPASSDSVLTDVTLYLNKMTSVKAQSSLIFNGTWILNSLINNTTDPTSKNGGMITINSKGEKSNFRVAYEIPKSMQEINNDLKNPRSFDMGMTIKKAEGNTLSVHIDGQAGFSVGSFLRFSARTGAAYDMTTVKGSSMECSVKMSWAGYNLVPIAPKAWQQDINTGWYYMNPISQAFENGMKEVDGFKFASTPPYNLDDLASGGNFGQFASLLISMPPTIEITYKNANYSIFKENWSQKISGNLTLFGFINLGSFNEGTYGSSFKEGSDNSTFTITFSASEEFISIPDFEKPAYVIAGNVQTVSGSNF